MKTYRELNIEDIIERLSSCEDFPTGEFEVCADEKLGILITQTIGKKVNPN